MGQDSFKRWYEKNKERLSSDRKFRYLTDPSYRKKAVERARLYRQQRAKSQRSRTQGHPPLYCYSFADMVHLAGVHSTTLRAWIRKGHLPKPHMFRGRYRFTEKQAQYIIGMSAFLHEKGCVHGPRTEEFSVLVSIIWLNW